MSDRSIMVLHTPLSENLDFTLQLLTKASELSKQKHVPIYVLCIDNLSVEQIQTLYQYGADCIINSKSTGGTKEDVAGIVKEIIESFKPELAIFPGNPYGKYLAAVCSTAFELGLTADCVNISIDDSNEYIFSRAALNATVIANIKCTNSPVQLCTVKENIFVKQKKSQWKNGKLIHYCASSVPNYKDTIRVLKMTLQPDKYINNDWQNAEIIFCIGRGVQNSETKSKIELLAKKYGAEVAGTRAAVEENLIEKNRQVGQSGFSICPDIYVGFGVSGASQHIVGIKNAKLVIAINKDEDAPIFQYADYKIIEDADSILDTWLEQQ